MTTTDTTDLQRQLRDAEEQIERVRAELAKKENPPQTMTLTLDGDAEPYSLMGASPYRGASHGTVIVAIDCDGDSMVLGKMNGVSYANFKAPRTITMDRPAKGTDASFKVDSEVHKDIIRKMF